MVYEVEATGEQVGAVLGQFAQDPATFRSFSVQPLSALAADELKPAVHERVRKPAAGAKPAAAADRPSGPVPDAARSGAGALNGSSYAADNAYRQGAEREQSAAKRGASAPAESPAAPRSAQPSAPLGAQQKALLQELQQAADDGGSARAQPPVAGSKQARHAADKLREEGRDGVAESAKRLALANRDEAGKGASGKPAAQVCHVVFVLRVIDAPPAAAATLSPAKPAAAPAGK